MSDQYGGYEEPIAMEQYAMASPTAREEEMLMDEMSAYEQEFRAEETHMEPAAAEDSYEPGSSVAYEEPGNASSPFATLEEERMLVGDHGGSTSTEHAGGLSAAQEEAALTAREREETSMIKSQSQTEQDIISAENQSALQSEEASEQNAEAFDANLNEG